MSNKPETVFCGETPVRTFVMNGRTKYAARDLCGILGYSRADKMLATINSRPEYIDVITRGGTQRIRVVEDRDIEKVLRHCRRHNAEKLRSWLRRDTQTATKPTEPEQKPTERKDEDVLLMFIFD